MVVVGASPAGLAAAETLRREGHTGPLTLIGDEPAAPYDRPPLSKEILSGTWTPDRLPLRTPADLGALGLDTRYGHEAIGTDIAARTVLLSDGSEVPYDGLIVATGVRPRRLPGTPAHVLRTLDDALALKDRLGPGRTLAVVGAGFLGAEAASVAAGLGTHVTLLEPAPVPLAHAVGEDVGRILAQVHSDHGVDLRTGTGVSEVVPGGVRLSDGSLIEADTVLAAVGSLPNTEWLTGSGLTFEDGLVCDEFCAAAPGVYGAGDVARWHNPLFGTSMRIEHRTNAAEQGMAAARNLLGAQRPFAPVPYFWSDQYDMKIRAYGYLRGHDEMRIAEGSLEERKFTAVYRTRDRLTGVLTLGMPPKTIRPWQQAIASRTAWHQAMPLAEGAAT
ncbi:putative FAD-dependent pyridine nucleotide-disulfide oxidoreductase [Streptomyces viridochromogenes Tue57]|uniref:Putative FAD-dependent pyridine nucleotide-disulfide oxidoreductase n=1 Tax=Streptomyces viridochromogenes Tue57 TaxID=1160705 RepID=L8P3S9_STRVR|nr:putative FAD-dependent pyridine nucleotide-disulfide oxidoreductase [Streptomyces viridochromogenes Tue57]